MLIIYILLYTLSKVTQADKIRPLAEHVVVTLWWTIYHVWCALMRKVAPTCVREDGRISLSSCPALILLSSSRQNGASLAGVPTSDRHGSRSWTSLQHRTQALRPGLRKSLLLPCLYVIHTQRQSRCNHDYALNNYTAIIIYSVYISNLKLR